MRMIPFGFSIGAILAQAIRANVKSTNVLWHVPKMEEQVVFHRGRRRKVKVGQAFGYNHGRIYTHATNGERECARRLRQIQRGQLKAENGLVT